MKRTLFNNLHLWQFTNLEKEGKVKHFVTDRCSLSADHEFTLSLSSTPDKELVKGNREHLAAAMDVPAQRLFFPSQVHGTRIVNVRADMPRDMLMETDALITDEKGVCIAVMSADCVPILLFDRKNAAVAAVHSGWKGTVARVLEKTLAEMENLFGTKGEDIIAGIGPSVSQESYEVGEEVIESVQETFGAEARQLLLPQPNGKAKLDLCMANKLQLLAFGVQPQAIEVSDLCTVKNNGYFYSARKGDRGRFAAGIMLRDDA